MENPAEEHWRALKRVMKYLYTTRDLWLTFGADQTVDCFTDADWGGQPDSHSISGYGLRFGTGVIAWSSKRQPIVTVSSAEAEYVATLQAVKEIYWARQFLGEFDGPRKGPTVLHCDNQSTIALTKDNKFHARMKHVRIRYHFVREAVDDGTIVVKYVPTAENTGDIFTKALPRPKFDYHRERLGLHSA
jgi:hypothetical protein